MDNTVTVNGKTYVEYNPDAAVSPVETDHIIVIAQRGWIFEGRRNKEVADKVQLLNANVVRSWSNGRGIGGLCKKNYKNEYTLDEVGTVTFIPESIIAIIDITEW